MMRQSHHILAAGFLALIAFLSGFRLHVHAFDGDPAAYADEILMQESDGDIQSWIDSTLPAEIGNTTPDWYIIALSQCGYDLSAYSGALQQYLASNTVSSGSTRERMALAIAACEPNPPEICASLLDESAGTQGIMSWIFALHLRSNGIPSDMYTVSDIADTLTGMQSPDGGWSLQGTRGDADITAMTLQALAPYAGIDSVSAAIASGIAFLSDAQLPDGSYQSYGTPNAESTAQVWIALAALGIDPLTDDRFIKNGCTIPDGLMQFRIAEGQYAHTVDGTYNAMATAQTFLALTAAGLDNPIYVFHGIQPQWTASPQSTAVTDATASQNTASTEETGISTEEIVHTTVSPADTPADTVKYPYRIPLTVIAAVLSGTAACVFVYRKKRSPKTWLTLGGALLTVTVLIWTIKIETPAQYYQSEQKDGIGNVTMTIRCDAILGMPGSEEYPADGTVMPLTEFALAENETVLDLLYDAVKAYTMQIETDGIKETAYVRGIASLYEFDFGELSGWTYTVNGTRPAEGCGTYLLQDGDRIEWIYTLTP